MMNNSLIIALFIAALASLFLAIGLLMLIDVIRDYKYSETFRAKSAIPSVAFTLFGILLAYGAMFSCLHKQGLPSYKKVARYFLFHETQ